MEKYFVSLKEAEEFLIETGRRNIISEILESIKNYELEETDDFNDIKEYAERVIQGLIEEYFGSCENKQRIHIGLHYVVYNALFENLMSMIKATCDQEDQYLFRKSCELNEENLTSKQLGSKENYAIQFPAACVELTTLENYKSPLEKLNCLSNTFDLMFAELKSVLVSFISKYSDKESDIPIVNNDEITPIITLVLIKSKLMYLYSNIFYIRFFSPPLCRHKEEILKAFEMSAEKLMKLEKVDIVEDPEKICTSMGVCKLIELTCALETSEEPKPRKSLVEEEKKRIAKLICVATTNESNS